MKRTSNYHNMTKQNEEILRLIHTQNYTRRNRTRLFVIHSYINGIEKERIAKMQCICKKTVKKYIEIYEKDGVNGLLEENPYRPKSDLEPYQDEIKKILKRIRVPPLMNVSNELKN